jgi:succinate dehydrogenase / fumarate reductase membrane anchor subunit
MSLRSPLGRVLGSGSAKDGTSHWWAQRVSAAALLILGLWFLSALLLLPGVGYEQVSQWLARPFNSVMLALLAVTLAYHSSLGVQVVIEDYVHGPFIKVISLILNKFFHFFLAAAALFAVFRISLGESI